jgi:hypothetical protein
MNRDLSYFEGEEHISWRVGEGLGKARDFQ